MTGRPLDFDFLPMSELSKRAPHAVPLEEQEDELGDELHRRRDFYPMLVKQGRGMNQEDADRHIAILDEILSDCRHVPEDLSADALEQRAEQHRERRAASRILWEDKVRELRREIVIRRNAYPKQIANKRATEAEAARRLEAIEAVHWRYWIDGFTWDDRVFGTPFAELLERSTAFQIPRTEYEIAAAVGGKPWKRLVNYPIVYTGGDPELAAYWARWPDEFAFRLSRCASSRANQERASQRLDDAA